MTWLLVFRVSYRAVCLVCAYVTQSHIIREQEIAKKESTLAVEKRTYMKSWLKKIFVGQAVITTVLGGLMVSWYGMI